MAQLAGGARRFAGLVLSGKPGHGETHLAIAFAYRAIHNRFDADACSVTAAELIDYLSGAAAQSRLHEALLLALREADAWTLRHLELEAVGTAAPTRTPSRHRDGV